MEIARGGVVGATVLVVLQNALTSIQEIFSMARHYEDCLEELKSSIEIVQGILADAEANRNFFLRREALVKPWLNDLEDLAFEADAELDEVMYKLLRRQVKNQNNTETKTVIGKNVINKLKEINKRAMCFDLRNTIAAMSKTFNAGLITANEPETDSFSVEPCVEGRDADVKNIVEMLTTIPSESANISVLSIWGMGGLGKTTVARKVFNHEKIEDQFDLKMWICVSVSTNFQSLSVYKLILGTLIDEKFVSREVVLTKLKQGLEGKRYMLVLDNVWDENTGRLDEFMNTLSEISSDKGNNIIVTTRNQGIASHVGTLATYQLSGLSQSQCWSIIKAKSFVGDVPRNFKTIGKDIAKRCDGLPLAAKVIGGLLRGRSQEYWCNFLENKLFDDDDGNISKILRLSYENLPTLSFKKCFAYCSVFPQDYSIEREVMIKLWMAEGFLQAGEGGDMETTGSEVFNRLVQYSLFQDANRDIFGDIVNCKMHDLVHDLACSISKDMNQVRYLALKYAYANEPIAISQRQNMKYLRTMFFEGEIANMFSNFRCLHVLKLTTREITELPSEIKELIHLRSLDISLTGVECLPDSIGKLYLLQTLMIGHPEFFLNPDLESHKRYTKVGKLPNTTTNLISLRHLCIENGTDLPPGIGKMTSLRTLRYYKVRDENGWRIKELGSLNNLQGELYIDLEMVKDKDEAKLANLSGKPGIFKLILAWDISTSGMHHENVLEGLQPHGHLKSLTIIRYGGKTLPSWTMSMAVPAYDNIDIQAFNSLVEIILDSFTQCEELPTLGHLRCLRFLRLKDWPSLRCIGLSFYGTENLGVPEIVFPALERLEMRSMPELTEWVEMDSGKTVFPCLKYLSIDDCFKLKSVHSHFPCLEKFEGNADLSLTKLFSNTRSLRCIEIRSLSGSDCLPVNLFVKNENLTDLDISHCPKLTRLVPSSLGGGASLKRLSIHWCDKLIELPNDLNTLCKLEVLSIVQCNGLKSIPYDASLTSLKELEVSFCGLTDLPIGLLNSCISFLEILTLEHLDNMENLDSLIPLLGRMSRLWKLEMLAIPKFSIKFSRWSKIGSLRTLKIGHFSEPLSVKQLTSILQKCPSLENLCLFREKHYDTLIKMDLVQHLSVCDF